MRFGFRYYERTPRPANPIERPGETSAKIAYISEFNMTIQSSIPREASTEVSQLRAEVLTRFHSNPVADIFAMCEWASQWL